MFKLQVVATAAAIATTVGATGAVAYPILAEPDITAVFVDSTPTIPDCEAGITVTVEATVSTACDLDGSQTLNLTWPGADGYDDAWARSEAADYGCATFAVIDGTATGINCDY